MGIGDNQIELRQLHDGSLLQTFTANNGNRSLAFTQDGQILLASNDAWRIADGRWLNKPDSWELVSANEEIVVVYGDSTFDIGQLVIDEEISVSLTGVRIPDEQYNVTAMALSSDGQLLAIGGWGDIVQVWHTADGTLLYTFDTESDAGTAMVRRRLAAPSRNNSPGPHTVTDLEFMPGDKILAAVSGFDELTLWGMEDGRLQQRIPGVGGQITISADGERLAAWDSTLTQWDMNTGTRLNQLKQHMGWITDLAFMPNGSHLVIGSDNIYIRSLVDGGLLTSLPHSAGNVALTPDGKTLLSTSDRELYFWNLANGSYSTALASESSWGISDLAIAADGQIAATVAHDDAIRLWRVNDRQLIYEGYSMFGAQVAFSPDGLLFTYTNNNADAIELSEVPSLYGLVQESLVNTLNVSERDYFVVHGSTFSPDGNLFVAGLDNGRIPIWQVADGTLLQTLSSQSNAFLADVVFSPDGEMLASISYNDRVEL
jgi:WD40 repeat protein